MLNELLSSAVPCTRVETMEVKEEDMTGFPEVQDPNIPSPTGQELFLKKLTSFSRTTNGIVVFSLIGLFGLSFISNLVLYILYRKSVFLHRFMKSEIQKLVDELDAYDKNKKEKIVIGENTKEMEETKKEETKKEEKKDNKVEIGEDVNERLTEVTIKKDN